jgi:hypothetical protein
MRGGVIQAEVGFRFHNASREESHTLAANQEFAEQIASDLAGISIEEFAFQGT